MIFCMVTLFFFIELSHFIFYHENSSSAQEIFQNVILLQILKSPVALTLNVFYKKL